MHKRTVELVGFDNEAFDYGNARKHVDDAVGYLSTWSFGSERYLNVSIWAATHHGRELTATYKDASGKTTYVIGAIEREDGTFSFHS